MKCLILKFQYEEDRLWMLELVLRFGESSILSSVGLVWHACRNAVRLVRGPETRNPASHAAVLTGTGTENYLIMVCHYHWWSRLVKGTLPIRSFLSLVIRLIGAKTTPVSTNPQTPGTYTYLLRLFGHFLPEAVIQWLTVNSDAYHYGTGMGLVMHLAQV